MVKSEAGNCEQLVFLWPSTENYCYANEHLLKYIFFCRGLLINTFKQIHFRS